MAVTSAMGIRAMAKNHKMTPKECRNPRNTNVPIKEPVGGALKMRYKLGAMMIRPKAYRMKADSAAGKSDPM